MPENLTVIEDCSPYYIRFRFDQLEKIISLIKSEEHKLIIKFQGSYIHKDFPENVTRELISCLPRQFKFDFITSAIFETPPRGGSGIHKDGKDNRISFNIPILVNDDKCVTYWYDNDGQFDHSKNLGNILYTRNIYKDHRTLDKFVPSKSMVAQENEMILFNTDIFHAWKNHSSKHVRKMFVLRIKDRDNIYFNDAKKILNF